MIKQQIELMVMEDFREYSAAKYKLAKDIDIRERLKHDIDEFLDQRFDADNIDT